MGRAIDTRPPIFERRRARRLAYWNGAVWAVGNGLASTLLIIYLATELGARKIGLGIALILAARHIVGLLQLGAPMIIGRLVNRKRFCMGNYLLGTLLLWLLPWVAAPGRLPAPDQSLLALVVLWCLYHLLQYLATIALFSWLGDLVPLPIRGRFFGRRGRWMVSGEAAAMLCAGLFVWGWQSLYPEQPRWVAYVIPAGLGAAFMWAALIPLGLIPPVAHSRAARRGTTLRALRGPLRDRAFRRLLAFGCWFSLFNGLTQSAQNLYQASVLGVSLFVMLALRTGMRFGQWGISPTMGRWADRFGNRPVMIGSQLLVAAGLLFYLLATPAQWWWLIGAWVLWIAYAGLNVCLPSLMLKLAPRQSDTPFIAVYYTASGLCYAASTIIGGYLFDQWKNESFSLPGGWGTLDFCRMSFLFGWVTRSMAVVLLWLLIEPPPGRTRPDYRPRTASSSQAR